MAEPLTAAELAAIKQDVESEHQAGMIGALRWYGAISRLLATVEAYREIAVAVAGRRHSGFVEMEEGRWVCPDCHEFAKSGESRRHTADCPVTRARALLGKSPTS